MLGCGQVGNVPGKEEVLCDNELGTVPSSVVEPSGYKYDDPKKMICQAVAANRQEFAHELAAPNLVRQRGHHL